jgi:tetratricopeptide (TPR) repeat protein
LAESWEKQAKGARLGNLGLAYADLGQVEEAIEHYQAALDIAREIGDRRNEGVHLGNLGIAYADLRQAEKAIEHLQAALVISREIGDRRSEGNHLGNLGTCCLDLAQTERAVAYYEQALNVAREIGDRMGEGYCLYELGKTYRILGEIEKAIGHYKQAIDVHDRIKHPRGQSYSLVALARALLKQDRLQRAGEVAARALALDVPETVHTAALWLGVANLRLGGGGDQEGHLGEGDHKGRPYEEAIDAFGIAVDRARDLLSVTPGLYGPRYTLACALAGLAHCAALASPAQAKTPDLTEARAELAQAMVTCALPGVLRKARLGLEQLELAGVEVGELLAMLDRT